VKKLPKGVWFDTKHQRKVRVVYYDSKSRCYRVEMAGPKGWWGSFRMWVGVETFKPPRYTPPTAWDMLDGMEIG
jgi:hypothetical protein